ncbi:B3 domain-containing transcription factor VRN1 [Trifolium repens]|nr:B3 domain-containing transcription factor VRN1 [Trifolium repens]
MNKKAKKCSTSKGNINGRDEEIEEVELSDDIDNKSSDDESDIPTQIQRTKSGKRKGRKRTTNYRSCGENPSFELQLSPSYANGLCLRIPNDFSREYLKGFKGTVKIRFGEDKAMKVKLIIDANGSSIITGGWKPFAEKYNLKFKVDYLCKFEMTQSNPFSFTITINPAITKPSYKGRSSSSDNNIVVRKCNTKGTSSNRRAISDSKGRNVIKHDTFELNVNSTTYPYVSNTFLHRHKECWGKFVKLKVNGKSWSVKVMYYPRGSRLSDGWTKFKEECNLEIGDRCRFKLIDEEKFVFEVSFERKK